MPSTKSHISFLLTLLAIVWGVLLAADTLRAQWSNPTANPPNNNPASFLTTGINPESKSGVLTLTNNFYVIGSGSVGKVGIGTSTIESSSRLVVEPYTNASIDAGAGSIRTSWQAAHNDDVINKSYLTSTLNASIDSIKYWTLSGNNLYASSTAYNIAIGTTTAGTAKLAVIGGNVGIGTTTPSDLLHLSKSVNNDYISNSITEGTNLRITNTMNNWGGAAGIILGNLGTTIGEGYSKISAIITSANSSDLAFQVSNNGTVAEAIRIKSDGNIGIGTTTPMVSLHVEGNVVADTPLAANHLATKSYVDTAAQSLWVNNGSYLYASSTSWRVGIGTTSPASALHIYPQTGIEGLRIVSSNYSPLVIMSSSSNNLFRVDEIGRTRSSAYCDIDGNNCFNPNSGWSTDSYLVTTTPVTYNGNRGGYVAANTICNGIISGSHVCTTGEILDTINAGFASRIPIGAENAFWFSSGPPGYTVNANDCIGFTSNSAGDFGTIWTRTSSDNQGAGGLNSCNDSKKIACCK